MTRKLQVSSGNPIRWLLGVPVPWVFVLTYLAGAGLECAHRFYTGTEPLRGVVITGAILLAAGAALATWCLLIFRKARTTTVPGATSLKLITRGPYRFSRNPMYVSLITAYLGEAGVLKQFWPILLLPLTIAYVNWIVIPVEEAKLMETFEAEYARYRARVRRWF